MMLTIDSFLDLESEIINRIDDIDARCDYVDETEFEVDINDEYFAKIGVSIDWRKTYYYYLDETGYDYDGDYDGFDYTYICLVDEDGNEEYADDKFVEQLNKIRDAKRRGYILPIKGSC